MKTKVHLLIVALLVAVLGTTGSVSAQTGEPTNDSVATRCSRSQDYVASIVRPKDRRGRVDRLQAYLYIYDRLDVFVQRLEHNSQSSASDLRQSLSQLTSQTNTFKNDYEVYDQDREAVITLKDCSRHVDIFQEKLETARTTRSKVTADVASLQDLIGTTIKQQLDNLYKELLATGQSGSTTNE